MNEGWNNEDYLILFDKTESRKMTDDYEIQRYLPGFVVTAIIGWDDFVVKNEAGESFRVPTVPLVQKHLAKIDTVPDAASLVPDEHLAGRIKWYMHPIVFGGDPISAANVTWVNSQQHQELVRWWNQKYREVTALPPPQDGV